MNSVFCIIGSGKGFGICFFAFKTKSTNGIRRQFPDQEEQIFMGLDTFNTLTYEIQGQYF